MLPLLEREMGPRVESSGWAAARFVVIALATACFRGERAPPASAPRQPAPAVRACVLPQPTGARTFAVRYDALGYLPGSEVALVVMGHGEVAPEFDVLDLATGCAVSSGLAGPRTFDATSLAGRRITGDRIAVPSLPAPGRYVVRLQDGSQFGPIVTRADAYAEVLPDVLRFLRAQRCGATTVAVSRHEACHRHASLANGAHSGDAVAVPDGHRGSVRALTGPAVDVEGGWHDAGDYIKFVGTTSFTLVTDLVALRDHDATLASPRAGSVRDELRDEMRWGLDWLLRMLGGSELLHQVSGERDHDARLRKPEEDTSSPIAGYDQRPAFRFAAQRGGNLLGRSAAALATGAQVFADDPAYAARLTSVARRVFDAALARPSAQSSDPPDFYPETSVDDDLALGAAALARLTSEPRYRDQALVHARAFLASDSSSSVLSWGDVRALALLETALVFPAGSSERAELARGLVSLAAPILGASADPRAPASAFGYGVHELGDGSVAQSLGAAAVCLAARRLGGPRRCVEVARAQLHWLFGANPFGIAFMVGAGTAFPRSIHHALAQTAKLTLVGAIVGGPTSRLHLKQRREQDASLARMRASSPFAAWSTDEIVYDDVEGNYVVNEPAIDFTASMVFDLAELLDQAR